MNLLPKQCQHWAEVVVASALSRPRGVPDLPRKELGLQEWTVRISLYVDLSPSLETLGAYTEMHNTIYVCI